MTIYGKGCISNYRNCSLSYVWYSVLYRMITLVGLVVDEKGGLRRVGLFHEFVDGQAMPVGTIVTSDDL